MTGNTSTDAPLCCRPLTRAIKVLPAPRRQLAETGRRLIHVYVMEILQMLVRKSFHTASETHILEHKHPSSPLPAASTPNQKTRDWIYTVSRSNRSFSFHLLLHC